MHDSIDFTEEKYKDFRKHMGDAISQAHQEGVDLNDRYIVYEGKAILLSFGKYMIEALDNHYGKDKKA